MLKNRDRILSDFVGVDKHFRPLNRRFRAWNNLGCSRLSGSQRISSLHARGRGCTSTPAFFAALRADEGQVNETRRRERQE